MLKPTRRANPSEPLTVRLDEAEVMVLMGDGIAAQAPITKATPRRLSTALSQAAARLALRHTPCGSTRRRETLKTPIK